MDRSQIKTINLIITITLSFLLNSTVLAKEIHKELFEKFDPLIIKNEILDITDYRKINDHAYGQAKRINPILIDLHKKLSKGSILKEGINKSLKLNCIEKKANILTCEDVIHITIDNRNIYKFDMIIDTTMILSEKFENSEIQNELTEVVMYAFGRNLEELNKNVNPKVMRFIPKGNALKFELRYPKSEKLIRFSDNVFLEKKEDYRYSSPSDYFLNIVKYNELEKLFLKTFENHGASERVIIKDIYPSNKNAEYVAIETQSCGASSCGKWISELIRYSNNEIKVNKFLGKIKILYGNSPLIVIEKETKNLLGDTLKIQNEYKIENDNLLDLKFKTKYEKLINEPPFDYFKKDAYRSELVKMIGAESFGKFRELFKIANHNLLQDGRFLILRGTAKPIFNKHGIVIIDGVTERVFAFEFDHKTMKVIELTKNVNFLKNKNFLFSIGTVGKHKCFSTKVENEILTVEEVGKANCETRLNMIR